MSNSLMINQMMEYCRNGDIEGVRTQLKKNSYDATDDQGNTLSHYATSNGHKDILRLLAEEGADFNMKNKQGATPLHIACEKQRKDIVLLLLMEKADYSIQNNDGETPGENDPDISIFIGDITDEDKCFKILSSEDIEKLINIFKDIDYDDSGKIDLKKSSKFNQFLEPDTPKTTILKDAEDFMKDTSLINKSEVCLEEWLFSFSKLYACDQKVFQKFIDDYNQAVTSKGGSFSVIMKTNAEEAEL